MKKVLITNTFENKPLSGYVAGWGTTGDEEDDKLHSCFQKIRSMHACNYAHDLYLPPGMFCAGDLLNAKNIPRTVPLDSGSAFIYKTFYQIGVVSYGTNEYPSLTFYTNVSYFYSWINENTKRLYCRNTANKIKRN
ncbi:mast cell protease 1A-like [Ostrinia furnacalis]|uniref:mast cell protease 1A-like n=1 Tax=Ostrinia furnacalis TaxID=93504 RepID=UPI00103B2782|nr:mast cell protease 1A-like [Ostrinia furnacalis]